MRGLALVLLLCACGAAQADDVVLGGPLFATGITASGSSDVRTLVLRDMSGEKTFMWVGSDNVLRASRERAVETTITPTGEGTYDLGTAAHETKDQAESNYPVVVFGLAWLAMIAASSAIGKRSKKWTKRSVVHKHRTCVHEEIPTWTCKYCGKAATGVKPYECSSCGAGDWHLTRDTQEV